MKVGFANIYSWDPHLAYSKKIFKDLSGFVDCSYFFCGGMIGKCYDKIITNLRGLNCVKCQTKQMFVFGINNSLVPNLRQASDNYEFDVSSTIASALRMDSYNKPKEYEYLQKELLKSCNIIASKFRNWLHREKIQLLIIYNGRFDFTKVLMDVACSEGIPVITHERSWFGTGVNLNWNKNCLSLKKFQRFNKNHHFPENIRHALAKILIAPRFDVSIKSNEWRTFKRRMYRRMDHFSSSKKNIVYFPSSPSEFLYEKELINDFQSVEASIRLLKSRFESENLIVKAHPIWGQRIRSLPKTDIDIRIKLLCDQLGVRYIPSSLHIDANEMILLADLVVTSSSSTALQAGILGKGIINLGLCEYSHAGFVRNVFNKEDLFSLDLEFFKDSEQVTKKTLDFIYSMSFEKMHFSDKMYMLSSRKLEYKPTTIFSPDMLTEKFVTDDYRPRFNFPHNFDPDDEAIIKKFSIQDFMNFGNES